MWGVFTAPSARNATFWTIVIFITVNKISYTFYKSTDSITVEAPSTFTSQLAVTHFAVQVVGFTLFTGQEGP
jgi:hypothetical protein